MLPKPVLLSFSFLCETVKALGFIHLFFSVFALGGDRRGKQDGLELFSVNITVP